MWKGCEKVSSDSPVAGYVGLHIYNEQGKHMRHFSWGMDLRVNKDHVERIV